jgi:F-type H+-transporting ATPase subunit alpha
MEEQVCVIYAGVNGYLDQLPLNKVKAFESGLLSYIKANASGVMDAIRTSKDLSDETAAKLKSAVETFAKTFA